MNTTPPAESEKYAPVDYDPFAGSAIARVVPTTEPQREVWLADRLGPEASLSYNESVTLTFSGPLDVGALQSALQELVQRHEALRATIGGEGVDLCIAATMALDVPVTDLSTFTGVEREASIAQIKRCAVETPFDIERGPLFRADIVAVDASEHLLVIAAHHVVCDGWSFGILVGDIARLYALRVSVSANELEAQLSFGDFALAQNARAGSPEQVANEAFWVSRFAGQVPVLDLPTDRQRAAFRTFTSVREDFVLDAGLVGEVRKVGSRSGSGLFATLLGSFAVLLQRIGAANDIVVGIPAAGQTADGLERLVGHCVTLLPIRVEVDPLAPMAAAIAATQSAVLDAYEHQDYTYGTLLKKLAIERDPSRLPLVSVLFNIDQALDVNAAGFPGVNVGFASNTRCFENFELFINAVQVKGAQQYVALLNSSFGLGIPPILTHEIAVFVDPDGMLGLQPSL